MRLWHQKLIKYLPRQQLLGQHRECCALRGKGWGKKHSVVDYVFTYMPEYLVTYHYLIMEEMKRRGYNPDSAWMNPNWRGNVLGEQKNWTDSRILETLYSHITTTSNNIFIEHNDDYLKECLENLSSKGIVIELSKEANNG